MTTLIEFLKQRLDDDEAASAAAAPGPWHLNDEGDEVLAVDDITAAEAFALSNRQQRATAAHIARHDPARVLAEVEAKRRIIEMCESALAVKRDVTEDWPAAAALAEDILDEMGVPYADHPDYDKGWKP